MLHQLDTFRKAELELDEEILQLERENHMLIATCQTQSQIDFTALLQESNLNEEHVLVGGVSMAPLADISLVG